MTDPFTQSQVEFDKAFAEASKPAPVIDPNASLPHYPASRYVEKNLAPEKTLTYGDVSAIARAQKLAEQKGVLTPEVAQHMLPMAMVEGRSGNFGILSENGFNPTPTTLKRFKDMGLSVTDWRDPAEYASRRYDVATSNGMTPDNPTGKLQFWRKATIQGPDGSQEAHVAFDPPPVGHMMIGTSNAPIRERFLNVAQKKVLLRPSGEYEGNSDVNARMMAAILAEKAAVSADKTPAGVVKRYNGQGRALETSDGVTQQADVNEYWKKVQDAKTMLNHPKNRALLDHYTAEYNKP
jgi:hypothetical protein